MARTDTTSLPAMKLNRPSGEVTFNFPAPSSNNRTLISIPAKSCWTTSLHWHETHTEFIRVVKGRLRVTIGETTNEVGPQHGDLRIDKYVHHEYMRADAHKEDQREDDGVVEVLEWTDPADGFKEVFFRNLFSILQDSEGKPGFSTSLQLTTTMTWLDNYDVVAPGPLGWYVTHAVYGAWSALGWVFGYKPWYDEYTPFGLRAVAFEGGKGHLKKTV